MMARRKDSIEKRQRRFLLPFFQFAAPALVFMIALPMLEDALCQFMRSQAPSAACMPIVPSMIWYGIYAATAVGIALSAWRFYRDHICGDAYLEDYENY
jgi:predicted nucleic acid-binding Zn ribbon protein